MPRPEKITTIQALEQHIDAWAAKKSLSSRFGTFRDMYERQASYSSMAKTFGANYRTVLNWVAKYEILTGVRRERQNSTVAKKSR